MLNNFIVLLGGALGIGIFSSIQPCQLSYGIAAVSILKEEKPATRASFFYLTGRVLVYILLGFIFQIAEPFLLSFNRLILYKLTGPLLIMAGMNLTGLLKLKGRLITKGSFLTGLLHSLALCPVTLGFFVGVIIPMGIKNNNLFPFTLAFGIGAALPVILAKGIWEKINTKLKNKQLLFIITGSLLIGSGVYLSLTRVIFTFSG